MFSYIITDTAGNTYIVTGGESSACTTQIIKTLTHDQRTEPKTERR